MFVALAIALAVLLVVGAVLMVRDAFRGHPFAVVWLCFDGLGFAAKMVADLLLFVASEFRGE